jgi:hypothetical protein
MRVFRDERGQVLTEDELLLEFLHLDAKGETDCEDIMQYKDSCTGKDGTLTEYNIPQYGDTVVFNSLAMKDERITSWYIGEPMKVTAVDLRKWTCRVRLQDVPLEYVTLLVRKGF